MLLFKQRLKLRDLFYEWADKERFGERTPEQFLAWMVGNGLVDEERALKLINKTANGRDNHEKPTA